jgi:nucleotide-binding universal stress UspA family protein
MNPWLVLLAIALVGGLAVLLPVAVATFSDFRRPWRVRCPLEGADAQVRIGAAAAARAAILARRPRVLRCSLWPRRRRCAQACLALAPEAWHRTGPGQAPPPRPAGAARPTILVPLDGAPAGESALGFAGDLARARDARVRLLRVAPVVASVATDEHHRQDADPETVRTQSEALAYLRRVAAALGDVEIDFGVRLGNPATEIVRDAEEDGADVIVMATHHRHGLAWLLRGSVAGRVQRSVAVPVVMVPYGETAAA